ncbi:MAG: tRNA dimethylallyltransferase [Sphingobacteriales bacterium]|jgi:tRNA dimethylallyltransferase
MPASDYPKIIFILGPTAVGKTAMGIKLAKHFGTEIISADSRQFFREMSIGTAKPSLEELNSAKHHFINNLSITDEYSVGAFEKETFQLIESYRGKKEVLVVVGGSGLYVDAIAHGFDDLPTGDPEIRENLNKTLIDSGIEPLVAQLKLLDPEYYAKVDVKNPQRVIRAIDVCLTTGKKFSSFLNKTTKKRPFDYIKIGLNLPRPTLYFRVNQRVDNMIQNGLIDEVASLKDRQHLNSLNTVGYSEIFKHLNGDLTLDEAIELIKRNTRRFAKRQITWFNKRGDVNWYSPQDGDEIIKFLENWTKTNQNTNQ